MAQLRAWRHAGKEAAASAASYKVAISGAPSPAVFRELYVGGLPQPHGIPLTAWEVLDMANAALVPAPGGDAGGELPVLSARVNGGGSFAFLEFRTAEACDAALLALAAAAQLRVGRPQGYQAALARAGGLAPAPVAGACSPAALAALAATSSQVGTVAEMVAFMRAHGATQAARATELLKPKYASRAWRAERSRAKALDLFAASAYAGDLAAGTLQTPVAVCLGNWAGGVGGAPIMALRAALAAAASSVCRRGRPRCAYVLVREPWTTATHACGAVMAHVLVEWGYSKREMRLWAAAVQLAADRGLPPPAPHVHWVDCHGLRFCHEEGCACFVARDPNAAAQIAGNSAHLAATGVDLPHLTREVRRHDKDAPPPPVVRLPHSESGAPRLGAAWTLLPTAVLLPLPGQQGPGAAAGAGGPGSLLAAVATAGM